jgi:hypothetical protein
MIVLDQIRKQLGKFAPARQAHAPEIPTTPGRHAPGWRQDFAGFCTARSRGLNIGQNFSVLRAGARGAYRAFL